MKTFIAAIALLASHSAFADNGSLNYLCYSPSTGFSTQMSEDNIGGIAKGHHVTVDLQLGKGNTPSAVYLVTSVSRLANALVINTVTQAKQPALPENLTIKFEGDSISGGVSFELLLNGQSRVINDVSCMASAIEAG